jgi:predicted nucleotidyltransferase
MADTQRSRMTKARDDARVQRVVEALRAYEPDSVYLFGSWARGEADALSDLDLVIIKRTSDPFFERLREVARLLPVDAGGVDILVYTPEEFQRMREERNAFAEMIEEEGVLIHGR